MTDNTIRHHVMGFDPSEPLVRGAPRDFTTRVYPLLPDETCWFLATGFDKATWARDAPASLTVCRAQGIPAGLERSHAGKGGHVWIFFGELIRAVPARKLGSLLLTKTVPHRPEIGLDSSGRFFPSQDTMPQGGSGNLIALPLQRKPREHGSRPFVDDELVPDEGQPAFLSSLRPMSLGAVAALVERAQRVDQVRGCHAPDRGARWPSKDPGCVRRLGGRQPLASMAGGVVLVVSESPGVF